MECRHIEDDGGVLAVGNGIDRLGVLHGIQLHDLAGMGAFVHLQGGSVQVAVVVDDRTAGFIVAGVTGAFALCLQLFRIAFLIHGEALFAQDFLGQFLREPERVGQFERGGPVQDRAAGLLHGGDFAVQQLAAALQRLQEAAFLHMDDFLDVVLLLADFRIGIAEHLHDDVYGAAQEFLVDAQQASVPDGTAQDAAQDIAAALIGRQDAVADHEDQAARMVRNDLQGDILLRVAVVFHAGNFRGVFHDGEHEVRLEVGRFALQYRSQAFQARAGIDVLMHQRRVRAVFVLVVLREDQVPQFQVPAAVAAGAAGRFAAAAFLAQVDVDFGARAAGAAADLPEVVLQAYDMVIGHPDDIMPDLVGLVVLRVDRDIQFVRRQFQFLRQELPAPGNDLLLEIIAEGEIAQHFKECMVARRMAHVLDIARADALLARRDARGRRFQLAREERFEGRHAGTDQEQRRIVLRNQGCARKPQMAPLLEKFDETAADFIPAHVLHLQHRSFYLYKGYKSIL